MTTLLSDHERRSYIVLVLAVLPGAIIHIFTPHKELGMQLCWLGAIGASVYKGYQMCKKNERDKEQLRIWELDEAATEATGEYDYEDEEEYHASRDNQP